MEELIGDDKIRIEVYDGSTLLKVLPDLIFDHSNVTRILNTDIHFSPEKADIRIKIYEQDRISDDFLGHHYISLDVLSERWQSVVFSNKVGIDREVSYVLTYRYTPPSDSVSKKLSPVSDYVLEFLYLRCIQKQDIVSPVDTIRIEVSLDSKDDPIRLPLIHCRSNSNYAVNKKVVFKKQATIRLWELDSAGQNNFGDTNDKIGDAVTIRTEKVARKVISFAGNGGEYELVYSVSLGESGPKEDTFYKKGEVYTWFRRDRDIYRGTVQALSRAALHFPGQIWPFVPFDPRRPYALEVVKEAIEELGFIGVKLYTRCGWMPWNNCEIYGDVLGEKLDARLQALYEYLTVNDLPVLNHTGPTGYPMDKVLAFPANYEKAYTQESDRPTEAFDGPGFPPFWELAKYPLSLDPKAALLHIIAEECILFAKYCHYVQKTTAPYAWGPVLRKFPNLRLTFAHSGAAASIYSRYKDILENAVKRDSKLKKALEDSILLNEDFPKNGFGADGVTFKAEFINKITAEVTKRGGAFCTGFSKDHLRREVENFCSSGAWGEWFRLWTNAYPTDWTSKIIEYEGAYKNVYSDIAYISGDKETVFVKLVSLLVEDAVKGLKPGGENIADKHLIGTDWFMVEKSGMSPEDFWNRTRKGFQRDGCFDEGLWRKWSSENTLNWLNLGPQMEKLEAFYKKYSPKEDPIAREKVKGEIPVWWSALKNYYDQK